MTEILVTPHGGRWAVKYAPDATPIAEYETRQLAEAAARDIALNLRADVVVHDAEVTPDEREPHVEDRRPGESTPDPVDARTGSAGGGEAARAPQAGL